jgi:iron complex outermembrane receptor protein
MRLSPVAGVENLFDRRHAGSVVVNATRGRFFEPGPVRRVTLAVRLAAE